MVFFANWLFDGDSFEIIITPNKSVTVSNVTFSLFHDTIINGITNAISSSTALSTSQRTGLFHRILSLNANTLYNTLPSNASSATPISGTAVGSTTVFNPSVINFITLRANPTVSTEVVGFYNFFIRKI